MFKSINKEEFSKEVEKFIAETGTSYLDAIMYVVEKKNIEYEIVKKLLTNTVKEKLESELSDLNLIKKTDSTLDI